MAVIRIKHIGPVTDTGNITLTPVMLIIGKQSSGKSTFLKILCFCRWLEKLIMVSNDEIIYQYTHNQRFLNELKTFHRFNDYFFSDKSFIGYDGDSVTITLNGSEKNIKIQRKPDFEATRYNSKLSFIPSERNLVSAIKNIDQTYRSSEHDVLFNYVFEWGEAKDSYTREHSKRLSFSDDMSYVNEGGHDFILLEKQNIMMPLYYASSGVQSALPLDVMIDYFTGLVGRSASLSKNDLTNVLLRYMGKDQVVTNLDLETLVPKIAYQSVQLFVEEPEQNLYPDSQRNLILNAVLKLRNAQNAGSHESLLVMTTHSPYVLSTLNVLMAEAYAMEMKPDSFELKEIVHAECLLKPSEYSAYYIQEDGVFKDLVDKDITMISGIELDDVSDWVEDRIARINDILYMDN